MSHLEQKIIEEIRAEGPINFEKFMEIALYYPGHGYYAKESTKIGRTGDFYTSPHLHPVFGAMIGRQMEEMWNLMGKPGIFHVVEMGAGMGYLARDLLEYLKGSRRREDFLRCIRYVLVELNPSIKAAQQTLLNDHLNRVEWVSELKDLEPFSGCLLSNELLDAFPVRLVEMEDELTEIYVAYDPERGLVEIKRPGSREIAEYFKEFSIGPPEGYRTEVNLRIRDWLHDVNGKLLKGFILTVDYGYAARDYYSDDRSRGTLLCYHRHRVNEDPYRNIGEQDLTAHINFSSLKKWGEEIGLKTAGFSSQGAYLVSLGIDEVIKELYGEHPDPFETAKIKGLVLPQGMGESHQVMIQYKGEGGMNLSGFSIRNQAKRL